MKLRIAAAALLLALALVSSWLAVRTSQQNDRIAALEQQLRAAQSKPVTPHAAPGQPAPSQPATAATPAERASRRPQPESPTCPEVETLNTRLRESAASLMRVQTRIGELESEVENLTRERARLTATEAEAQTKLADITRSLETLQAERPQLESRIKDVEMENARLKQQNQASSQKNAQFGQLVTELQEVSRRQQVYSTNIQRRYRELTDLFRALPGMVETKGNGPELARIQTAISMADEDLRQLNDLSSRLGRVQKQIAAAVASR
jgi:DNA repair exonuclease SbcCD ATPase subunit